MMKKDVPPRDVYWDEDSIDISKDAAMIWDSANKLRGTYLPDKYGDVVIPMTILRRFECTLQDTKRKVIEKYRQDPTYPYKAMCRISGYQFYCVSEYTLKELCNDPDNLEMNFKNYISGFSPNVQTIMKELDMEKQIEKMSKGKCLYSIVKAFSELDLHPSVYDSIKMGYIFENLIGRFYENVEAGQYYTGRDIIKLCVSLLISEGCEDIYDEGKIITICDQACGTGGMLTTAYNYLKHYNPQTEIHLYGQELMGTTYAIGLAEMLIKGQNTDHFVNADTLKVDCFPNEKMRFVLENPPFGTSWGGKDAKEGQEDAVNAEYQKGMNGRWGAGLPAVGDAQLLFVQSAIDKLDDERGRAAIIENGSALYSGNTSSGESQIRRWLLENDLLEAIIQLPEDLFYNTGINTYIWIISKNKRPERKNKIQLIDASGICHKLRKPLGNKKNEFYSEDRAMITKLYSDFVENDLSKIFPTTEFIYKEYTVKQPLQRSYAITEQRLAHLENSGILKSLWSEQDVSELLAKGDELTGKERVKLDKLVNNKPIYDSIFSTLRNHISDKIWLHPNEFIPTLTNMLSSTNLDSKFIQKIAQGLSVVDKKAIIQKDRKGNILYDPDTKQIELVNICTSIEDYMAKEVLPYVPDAVAFYEEKNDTKKTGAEIHFTRYFYNYEPPRKSEDIKKDIDQLQLEAEELLKGLF